MDEDLPNFSKINDTLFRGGQPSAAGVKRLAELGVRTIVNFRDRQSSVLREQKYAAEQGIRFINIRLSNWFSATDDEMHRIIEIIRDPANHPVFVHCKRGADRTGTVIAIYRMLVEGWTDREANREAKRHGIGWWQVWMRDYIKSYYKRNLKIGVPPSGGQFGVPPPGGQFGVPPSGGPAQQEHMSIIENYLADAIQSFRNYKKLADRAMQQVSDEEFFRQIDEESNSIALIVKHIAGNQRSRWRDFLTTDGEKADRNRDTEFEMMDETRASMMEFWESGWATLFGTLESLVVSDFEKTVTIRGEPHAIVEAINRQLTHYAYHIGQIAFVAKHFRAGDWKSLSVPRGRSDAFNKFLADKQERGDGKGIESSWKFKG